MEFWLNIFYLRKQWCYNLVWLIADCSDGGLFPALNADVALVVLAGRVGARWEQVGIDARAANEVIGEDGVAVQLDHPLVERGFAFSGLAEHELLFGVGDGWEKGSVLLSLEEVAGESGSLEGDVLHVEADIGLGLALANFIDRLDSSLHFLFDVLVVSWLLPVAFGLIVWNSAEFQFFKSFGFFRKVEALLHADLIQVLGRFVAFTVQ